MYDCCFIQGAGRDFVFRNISVPNMASDDDISMCSAAYFHFYD